MKLKEMKDYLDELLEIEKISDISLNGLVVENEGSIENIYSAVDTSAELVRRVKEKSLIVVHHGLYWGKPVAITKNMYKIIKGLINKDSALYVSHLPLDSHEIFGNNHGFYKLIGWDDYKKEPFGDYMGTCLSSSAEFPYERALSDVVEEVKKIFGNNLLLWDFGKK